jgi:cytochrome c553
MGAEGLHRLLNATPCWVTKHCSVLAICGAVAGALASACQAGSDFQEVPESICASGQIWTYADKDSPLMSPGRSCVACHAATNDPVHAPLHTVAGTVMRFEHEADDCRGAARMKIILTDASGAEWTLLGNSGGNFWLDPESAPTMPYTARIVDAAGNERVQQTPVADGDCASCHTRDGANGAGGRSIPPDAPSIP